MTPPTATAPRKTILAWCLYDWGNSAFTTLVVTFIYATYFTKTMAPTVTHGTFLWSQAVGASALLVALLAPLLGAMADRGANRKPYLGAATLICILATALLTFIAPGSEGQAILALSVFVIANVSYELGIVFYNAYLPELASEKNIGRLSGYGWGLGYVGGILSLLLALLLLVQESPLLDIGTPDGFQYRATNLLVAFWFFIFSLPLILSSQQRKPPPGAHGTVLGDLRGKLGKIHRHPEAVRFLIAHLIYNDGLVTVFAFGGIYAAGTFGMTYGEVIWFGIVLNIAAGIGAFCFGFADDRWGGKRMVLVSLAALAGATILAVLAPNKEVFWLAGIIIGIFAGPNQSASRSLMARFSPEHQRAEFFGFFTLSGKLTSFLGPVLLGWTTHLLQSQRAGVSTILIFFLVGGLLLTTVDEKKGITAARQSPS